MRKLLLLIAILGLVVGACADEASDSSATTDTTDSTTTSDTTSTTVSTGTVTLQSSAFTPTALMDVNAVTAVTDFQFCITKIQLTAEGGTAVEDESGATSIEAILGLVDVSDPSVPVDWGTLADVPVGFGLSELMVEVHKDAENCDGAGFSLSYNGTALNQDIEFKFIFDPAVALDSGDTLALSMLNIQTAIQEADDAAQLTDETINSYLENVAGEGSED